MYLLVCARFISILSSQQGNIEKCIGYLEKSGVSCSSFPPQGNAKSLSAHRFMLCHVTVHHCVPAPSFPCRCL